jgi:hypothetical protein
MARKLVYRRTPTLLLGWVVIVGIAVASAFLLLNQALGLGLALLLAIVVIYLLMIRPCLIVRADGLVVRNLKSTRIAWDDVQSTHVERQEGYYNRAWGMRDRGPDHDNWRTGGYYGLVIFRRSGNPVAVWAVSDGRNNESTRGGKEVKSHMKEVAHEIVVGRNAAGRGLDPIDAIKRERLEAVGRD